MPKRIFLIPVIFLSLLFIPLISMQFSDQVKWTTIDFVAMGGLLLAAALGVNLIISKNVNLLRRTVFIILLIIAFMAVYVELAVGVFGTPFAGS